MPWPCWSPLLAGFKPTPRYLTGVRHGCGGATGCFGCFFFFFSRPRSWPLGIGFSWKVKHSGAIRSIMFAQDDQKPAIVEHHARHARALRRARGRVPARNLRPRRQPEHRRVAAAPRGLAAVRDPRFRLRAGARSQGLRSSGPRRHRPGGLAALRRHGAQAKRVRGVAAGLPQARAAAGALRRGVRQRGAVPRAMPGAAARARSVARHAQAARGAVQLESAWQERGRLEPRALRRLPRSGDLARLPVGCGIRRAQPLLPPERTAARAAAVARGRMALRRYNPARVTATEQAMRADADKPAAEPIERVEGIAERLAFKSRFALVFGEISHQLARTTCERLIALAEESDAPISVLISSPGGHVESADAIHDVIRFIRAPVTTVGTGWVASAGTHIFLAAPKERRVCLPNTRFMIPPPGGGAGGPATDIAIQAKEILRTRERIARVIAKQTGKSYEKVLADMERDFWLNAAEAVDYGIVSRIIESSRELS